MSIKSVAIEKNKSKKSYKRMAELAEHYSKFALSNRGKVSGKFDDRSMHFSIKMPIHSVETLHIDAKVDLEDDDNDYMEFYFRCASKLKCSFSLREKTFITSLKSLFSSSIVKFEYDDDYLLESNNLELIELLLDYHQITKKLINYNLEVLELDSTGHFKIRINSFIDNTYFVISIMSFIENLIDKITIHR